MKYTFFTNLVFVARSLLFLTKTTAGTRPLSPSTAFPPPTRNIKLSFGCLYRWYSPPLPIRFYMFWWCYASFMDIHFIVRKSFFRWHLSAFFLFPHLLSKYTRVYLFGYVELLHTCSCSQKKKKWHLFITNGLLVRCRDCLICAGGDFSVYLLTITPNSRAPKTWPGS